MCISCCKIFKNMVVLFLARPVYRLDLNLRNFFLKVSMNLISQPVLLVDVQVSQLMLTAVTDFKSPRHSKFLGIQVQLSFGIICLLCTETAYVCGLVNFKPLLYIDWSGRTKKCDQCVQCDRPLPGTAGRPVWWARASGLIKRGANYVGRPRSAISAICHYLHWSHLASPALLDYVIVVDHTVWEDQWGDCRIPPGLK